MADQNNIVFSISADTKGLESTIALLEKLGQVDKKTAEQFRSATEEYKKSTTVLTQAADTQNKASQQFSASAKGIELLTKALKDLGINIPKSQLQNFADGVLLGLQDAMQDVSVQTKGTTKSLSDLSNAIKTGTGKSFLSDTLDQAKNLAKTSQGLDNLKTRLQQARAEAQRLAIEFGNDSKQAVEAQKNVAGLQHELNEFNQRVKAFNPENKFVAIASAFQGIAGSVAIASGALTLFGVESERTEAITKKLDAALKLTAGLSALTQLGGEAKNLGLALGLLQPQIIKNTIATSALAASEEAAAVAGTQAAAGTTAFSTALRISPIGIFLTVLTAAAAAYLLLSDSASDASESQKKLNEATDKAIENSSKERVAVTLKVKEYENLNTSQERRREILTDLQDEYPAYFGNLNLESATIDQVREAYTKLTEALIIKAKMDSIISAIAEINTEQLKNQNKGVNEQLTAFQRFLGLDDTLKKALVDGKNKAAAKDVDTLTTAYIGLAEQLEKIGGGPSKQEEKKESPKLKVVKKEIQDEAKLRDELRKKELAQDLENLKIFVANRKNQINESNVSQEQKAKELSALELAELELRLLYNEQYGENVGDIQNQIADFHLKSKKQQVDNEQKYLDEQFKLWEQETQAFIDKEEQKKELQKEFEKQRNEIILQAGIELVDGLFSIAQAGFENQIAELEKQAERETEIQDKKLAENQAAFDKREITAKQFRANEEKLNKEKVDSERRAQAQINDIKRKSDIANRLQKLFEIGIATNRNIVENPLLALFYGLLGATQAGIVLATPLPQYAKGTLNLQGKNDEVPIIAHRGEAITPVKQSKEYNKTLAAIHNRSVPAFALNDFVKNFTVKDMPSYSSTSTANYKTEIDYDKLGKVIAWEMRGSGDVRIKNYKQLADAMAAANDPRRNR